MLIEAKIILYSHIFCLYIFVYLLYVYICMFKALTFLLTQTFHTNTHDLWHANFVQPYYILYTTFYCI